MKFEVSNSSAGANDANALHDIQLVASPYSVVSTVPQSWLTDAMGARARETITDVVNGMTQVEMLMGLTPGRWLQSLVIVDSPVATASVSDDSRRVIVRTAALLDKELSTMGLLVGGHEAFHSIDRGSQQGLSGGGFREFYDSQRASGSSFLAQIAESAFFQRTAANIGHPATSAEELAASTLNSLLHPQWSSTVASLDAKFVRSYEEALSALAVNVTKLELQGFQPDGLTNLLGKRIAELRTTLEAPRRSALVMPARPSSIDDLQKGDEAK